MYMHDLSAKLPDLSKGICPQEAPEYPILKHLHLTSGGTTISGGHPLAYSWLPMSFYYYFLSAARSLSAHQDGLLAWMSAAINHQNELWNCSWQTSSLPSAKSFRHWKKDTLMACSLSFFLFRKHLPTLMCSQALEMGTVPVHRHAWDLGKHTLAPAGFTYAVAGRCQSGSAVRRQWALSLHIKRELKWGHLNN